MAETHGRVMESSGWSTTDVWPVPVECLLNGMTPTDTHLMFGGGHMIQHQFRQRFQTPLQQLTGTSQHLVSINPNVSIPSHSIIEGNVTVDGNGQVEVNGENGQDTLSQNMPMNDNVLDESDESSDADEDLSQSDPQMSLTHALSDNSMVQCGGDQVPVVQDNLVHAQLPMNGDPHNCHHGKLRNDVTVMDHHALHDPPINPLFFQQQDQFEPPPVIVDEPVDEGGNDPNTGFSVYGKLYYEREGRVVLHLKQWMDSPSDGSGMTFDPSDPLQGKNLLQGCALCRLSSPNPQDSYRNQKQGHRHTFRGVLFTFEECTIVELYPEQNHSITSAHNNGLKPNDSRKILEQQQQNGQQRLGISSYLPPPELQQQQHLELNPLQAPTHPEHKAPPPPPDHHQVWWDQFESEEELKDNEDSSELSEEEVETPSPIRDHREEIVQDVIGTHEQIYPEESTNYQTASDSPYLQETECEPQMNENQDESQGPPALQSLILIDHQNSGQDENLSTPTTLEENQEDLTFNLVESEAEDLHPSSPIPQPPAIPAPSTPPPPPVKLKRKFECPCCPKCLPLKKTLKIHLESEHEQNPFRCHKCSQQFTDSRSLCSHPCGGHQDQRSTFTTPLSQHQMLGTSNQNGKGFIKCENVQWNNGDADPNGSGGVVKSKKFLASREKVGAGAGGGVSRLKKEKKRRHVKNKGHSTPKKLKSFPCTLCPKSFSVQRRLDTHSLSHVNEKSSQCEKCGKRFARKDKLMRHMYVHSEEKMFACNICSKRFSRRDKLADHLKSHGGPDEIHHCPLCKKEFLRPDILKQHVKLHGMGNKHQCPECLRFVTGQDRLQQHMARHEEAKAQGQPLLCPLCTKNFIQRQSLKAHIKKFHPTAHARLLSDLDFPPDQFEIDGELDELEPIESSHCLKRSSQGHGSHRPKGRKKSGQPHMGLRLEENEPKEFKSPFDCEFCSKRFSKKGPLLRHITKYHESQVSEFVKPKDEVKPIRKKVKKPIPRRPPKTEPNQNTDSVILTFTSAASQILSPSTSPPPPPAEDIQMTQELGLRGQVSSEVTGQGGNTEPGFHLSQPTPGITLTTVSVRSNPVSSAGQNSILMGSHSLHHAHALLQHTPLPPMAHPQGQLHTHIGQVSMQHHVTQQTMCTPYVIYPHYYQ